MSKIIVVVAALLAVIFLMKTVEPCTKNFIEDMMIKMCRTDNRSSDIDWSGLGRNSSIWYYPKSNANHKYSPRLQTVKDNDEDEQIIPTVGSVEVVSQDPSKYKNVNDLINLIKECCVRKCSVKEFVDICGRK